MDTLDALNIAHEYRVFKTKSQRSQGGILLSQFCSPSLYAGSSSTPSLLPPAGSPAAAMLRRGPADAGWTLPATDGVKPPLRAYAAAAVADGALWVHGGTGVADSRTLPKLCSIGKLEDCKNEKVKNEIRS